MKKRKTGAAPPVPRKESNRQQLEKLLKKMLTGAIPADIRGYGSPRQKSHARGKKPAT